MIVYKLYEVVCLLYSNQIESKEETTVLIRAPLEATSLLLLTLCTSCSCLLGLRLLVMVILLGHLVFISH